MTEMERLQKAILEYKTITVNILKNVETIARNQKRIFELLVKLTDNKLNLRR